VRPTVPRGLAAAIVLALAVAPRAAADPASEARLEVDAPKLAHAGVDTAITVRVPGAAPGARVEVADAAGRLLAEATLDPDASAILRFPAPAGGDLVVRAPDLAPPARVDVSVRTIPGWLSLVPPLLAIGCALVFRQVVPALVAGVWAGAWLVHGGPIAGAMRTMDVYVVGALTDRDRVSILVFSLLLGGMVGVVSRSGGMLGLVRAFTPLATTRRRGQLVTWLLGLVVFFDDYANTLLVGNTMRPVTDRLRVSREKLAYVVDSTAAPVASIALVSTWIGYQVSLVGDALAGVGSPLEAYGVFLRSIAYNFYPLFALVLGVAIATMGRDFGPMLAAERRAAGGKVLADTAVPLADFDREGLSPEPHAPHRWWNAAIPVLTVLLVTFAALWSTGRAALVAEGRAAGTLPPWSLGIEGLGAVFGAGQSYEALLLGSAAGCLAAIALAVAQRILGAGQAVAAWVGGIKSMALAIVILALAWAISDVCGALDTPEFLVSVVADVLDPRALPAIVFVLAAATAFATGTSWTTMGILIPLAVPTVYGVAAAAGASPAELERLLVVCVSAVLAGAIFGDHCSPISDTTVMSSMASGCDHLDHVRTQLPYALVGGAVAIVAGYVPAGLGVHPAPCLAAGAIALVVLVRLAGRTTDAPAT
jgi:Na+/H+ antiporter NhaC